MNKIKLMKIPAIKRRNTFAPWFSHIAELNELLIYYNEIFYKKSITNIKSYEYIPVTIIACFQSFSRFKIQELLDFGEPFLSNSKKISQIKSLKLEINDLLEITKENLSVSEIIAHHLSFNNLESLNAILSTLTGNDFFHSLTNFEPPRYKNEKIQILRENKESIFKDITSIFELRNIYCHEFNSLINIDISTLLRYLNSAIIFIENIDCYLYEIIKKGYHTENLNEKENFEKSENELTELIKRILVAIDEMGLDSRVIDEELNSEISLWKKYRQKQAKQLAGFYDTPHDQYKQRFWKEMERLTSEKNVSLNHSYSLYLSLLQTTSSIEQFS